MRQEYRAFIEAEICAERKLQELAARKGETEKSLAEINQAVDYQERGLAEARERLKQFEDRAFKLEAKVAG